MGALCDISLKVKFKRLTSHLFRHQCAHVDFKPNEIIATRLILPNELEWNGFCYVWIEWLWRFDCSVVHSIQFPLLSVQPFYRIFSSPSNRFFYAYERWNGISAVALFVTDSQRDRRFFFWFHSKTSNCVLRPESIHLCEDFLEIITIYINVFTTNENLVDVSVGNTPPLWHRCNAERQHHAWQQSLHISTS